MSIRCTNGSNQTHEAVLEVKLCYSVPKEQAEQANEQRGGHRENRFAGNCLTCKGWVEAYAGHIEKVNGKFQVFHNSGECVSRFQVLAGTADKTSPLPMPDVPAGYYATPSLTGHNDYDFWKVDRPESGTWKGYTFVKRVIGGHSDKDIPRDSKQRVKTEGVARVTQRAALQAIVDFGIEKANETFGTELKYCRKCGIHLTDETSRALGIGPTCRAA